MHIDIKVCSKVLMVKQHLHYQRKGNTSWWTMAMNFVNIVKLEVLYTGCALNGSDAIARQKPTRKHLDWSKWLNPLANTITKTAVEWHRKTKPDNNGWSFGSEKTKNNSKNGFKKVTSNELFLSPNSRISYKMYTNYERYDLISLFIIQRNRQINV